MTASTWRELVAPAWGTFAPAIGRYLAARAFASWVAYQGNGLRAIVSSVEAALAVLGIETVRQCQTAGRRCDRALLTAAIRRSDLLLVHYADRQALADISC
jgi:hypothetical protein